MAPAPQPQMTNEFVEKHMDIVQKQARQQHKQSNLFSVEDIEQAIWLHMATNYKFVMDKDPEEISKFAYRAAATYCMKEREDFMYFTGSVIYSGDMVERILGESTWVELEQGVDVDGRVDVQRAFQKLTPAQKRAVYERFALKKSTTDIDDQSMTRGVRGITNYLNSRVRLERAEMEDAARAV